MKNGMRMLNGFYIIRELSVASIFPPWSSAENLDQRERKREREREEGKVLGETLLN